MGLRGSGLTHDDEGGGDDDVGVDVEEPADEADELEHQRAAATII